jgi:outer membrane murein-binding lipoprotein Lpp
MKMHLISVALCAMSVAGCSSDADLDDVARPVAAAPAASVAAATPGTDFCNAVALHDSESAVFDDATRRRMYADNFRQCVLILGEGAQRVAGSGATTTY